MHRKGKRGDPCWEKGTGRGDYCKAMKKGLHMKEALLGKRKRKRGLVGLIMPFLQDNSMGKGGPKL